jgi:hypothetical protein
MKLKPFYFKVLKNQNTPTLFKDIEVLFTYLPYLAPHQESDLITAAWYPVEIKQ